MNYYYDFYYEVELIVFGGLPKDNVALSVDSLHAPSPKRPRFENSSADPSNSSAGATAGLSEGNQSEYRGGKSYVQYSYLP